MSRKKFTRVLFDMDGVLTDFESVAPKTEDGKVDWKKIKTYGREWWSSIPWLEEGKKLITEVMNLGVTVGILSAIFTPAGKAGKRDWIKKNLPMLDEADIKIVCRGYSKPFAACSNDLLVDDQPRYVDIFNKRFENSAILYTGFESTLEEIKKKLEAV